MRNRRRAKREEAVPVPAPQPCARATHLARKRSRSSGLAGEQFVLAYEQWKLQRHGLPTWRSRWTCSVTLGDGLGFDIRSFDLAGNEQSMKSKPPALPRTARFLSHATSAHFPACANRSTCTAFSSYKPPKFSICRAALMRTATRSCDVPRQFLRQTRLQKRCIPTFRAQS